MKVCLVTTFFPPHSFGGDGVYVRRLARALARRGHRVTVVSEPNAFAALGGLVDREEDGLADEPNVMLRPLDVGSAGRVDLVLGHQLGYPVLRRKALARALDGPFDVIHFHNVSLLGGPGVLRYGRAVKLCTLHDYWFVCAMHVLWRFDREACSRRTCVRCGLAGRRPPQLWRATSALERAARAVDAFIAPSDFARQRHLENGFPAPIRVLPHFATPPAAAPAVPPTSSGRPFFLYAGRLEKLKGVADLIEAFRSFDAADLVIAGTGTQEASLRQQAADLPHVRFLGWQRQSQLDAWYREAHAVVLPSRCYETFGLTPIEAFALGTPTVVRAGGAAEELVAAGGGMVYHDSEQLRAALSLLVERPDQRAALGAAGRRRYQESFSEDAHLAAYFDLIGPLRARHGAAA